MKILNYINKLQLHKCLKTYKKYTQTDYKVWLQEQNAKKSNNKIMSGINI